MYRSPKIHKCNMNQNVYWCLVQSDNSQENRRNIIYLKSIASFEIHDVIHYVSLNNLKYNMNVDVYRWWVHSVNPQDEQRDIIYSIASFEVNTSYIMSFQIYLSPYMCLFHSDIIQRNRRDIIYLKCIASFEVNTSYIM